MDIPIRQRSSYVVLVSRQTGIKILYRIETKAKARDGRHQIGVLNG